MKKKMLITALCVVMSMALCACEGTTPGSKTPAGSKVTMGAEVITGTPAPTATPSALEEEYAGLPISNYEDYVASTVLPKDYVGMEVAKVTEADVDVYIQEVLANNKVSVLKDGPLVMGDTAIIDYTGYVDGVAFEGGSDIGKELELGSGEFLDGFEEGLVGAKKGDKVTLELSFPIDYWAPDLAGKDVVFEVRINTASEMVEPEFTDEFVTTLTKGDYTTTEDFRGYSLGFLTEQRKYNSVMDYLVENATFGKFNEEYVQKAFSLEKEYYAMMYGFDSVEAFEEKFTAEASVVLWQMVEAEIRRYEQDRVVLYCVAKEQNITFTEEEYATAVEEYAASNGFTVEELYEVQSEESLRQSLLMEKALEFLLDSVVEVEKGAE